MEKKDSHQKEDGQNGDSTPENKLSDHLGQFVILADDEDEDVISPRDEWLEDIPFHLIDNSAYDYPFLQKIFQTLFANQDFVGNAFFQVNNCLPHMKEMANAKSTLYHLMIRQMLFDGYGSVAENLQVKIDSSFSALSFTAENTLEKMFNILYYIEMRAKNDVKFSNLLNWFLSMNVDAPRLVPPPELHSDQMSETAYSTVESTTAPSVVYETDSECARSLSLPPGASVGPSRQLQVAYKFGQIGNSPGCLDTPHGFCLGLDDDIVIADTNNHRVCVFTLQGRFKFSFGEYGTENGKLHQPRKIAMLPPAVLRKEDEPPLFVVCDRGNKRSRMQIFTTQGHFVRVIEIPSMDIVSGLITTQDRHIVVVDSVRSGVMVIDEFGGILNWFNCAPHMMEPSDIAMHNKHYYICDFKGHCVSVFNNHGVLVNRLSAKMLKFPNGIDISDYGDIICGDSHGNRFHISVFNEHGDLVGDYDCPFVKVSRCCGLRLSQNGLLVTLAKNNNHAVVLNAITVRTPLDNTQQ